MAASDFLKTKWRSIFMANDINKDGVITIDDANMFAERFAKHHKLDDDRALKLKADFQKFWRSMFLCERDLMKPDDYIKEMTAEFERSEEQFCTRIRELLQFMVDIFDVNGDGKISEHEFVVVVKCWGIDDFDVEFVKKFPQSPVGFIPKADYRDAWVYFFINNEPSKINQERPVLESLGISYEC